MKTKLRLFGMQFDMAKRARRCRFIVIFYGIFAALLLANWTLGSRTGGGFWTIEFTILIAPILGGHFAGSSNLFGRAGLVAPFSNRTRLKYPESASFLRPSSLLHPVVDNDPELRVDERAVRRRDYAHYLAYRFVGGVISVAFILEFANNSTLHESLESIGMTANAVNLIVYYLLQIGYISFMTLPQAILLWTEPDMEQDQA